KVGIAENRFEEINRGTRVYGHAGFNTLIPDHLNAAMDMGGSLVMYGNQIGSCFDEIADPGFRVFNHQVYIQKSIAAPPRGFDDKRAVADIWYKMAVHHIAVEPFCSSIQALPDIIVQVSIIGS